VPNPGGANSFGGFELQTPYGDVKKQTQLNREAPISGSPLAAQAINAPRRAQKSATRPGQQPTGGGGSGPPTVAPPPDAQNAQFTSQSWQEIAAVPGASDLVKTYALRAQNG
jgi:hypothetical protein